MLMWSTSSRMCSFPRLLQFPLRFLFISARYQGAVTSAALLLAPFSVQRGGIPGLARCGSVATNSTVWPQSSHPILHPRCYWMHCCVQCRQQECQTWRQALLDHSHMTTPGCRKSRKCLFRRTIENSCVSATKEEAYPSYPFPLPLSKLFPTWLHGSVPQSNQAAPSFLAIVTFYFFLSLHQFIIT